FVWEAKDRYPTAAELRAMAFLALVEGAQGIAYYSYGSVTGRPKTTIAAAQPELWRSVKKLNHELAEVGPRLLSGTESKELKLGKGTSAVTMKAVRGKEGGLAVVVNSGRTRQDVKVVGQEGTFARMILQNGKEVEVKDGVALLLVEPFGVEIVRWGQKK